MVPLSKWEGARDDVGSVKSLMLLLLLLRLQAIAENGGARKVVTGSGGFCACLTASGRCSLLDLPFSTFCDDPTTLHV